jgi:hypothetical protein
MKNRDTATSKQTDKDNGSNEQSQSKTGMRDSKSLSDGRRRYAEKNMGNHSRINEAGDRGSFNCGSCGNVGCHLCMDTDIYTDKCEICKCKIHKGSQLCLQCFARVMVDF